MLIRVMSLFLLLAGFFSHLSFALALPFAAMPSQKAPPYCLCRQPHSSDRQVQFQTALLGCLVQDNCETNSTV